MAQLSLIASSFFLLISVSVCTQADCTMEFDGQTIECCESTGTCMSSSCTLFGSMEVNCNGVSCPGITCDWAVENCNATAQACFGVSRCSSGETCSHSGLFCLGDGASANFKICGRRGGRGPGLGVLLVAAEPVDCVWGQWAEWSSCDATCGDGSFLGWDGLRYRTRDVIAEAENRGYPCLDADSEESEWCESEPPCPGACEWGPWGVWNLCPEEEDMNHCRRRTRTKVTLGDCYGGHDSQCQFLHGLLWADFCGYQEGWDLDCGSCAEM